MRESPGDWDFLVIGGGATGLGAAVDAAARGYRTLLVEQSDFAKATSSRSTKLIHGGLRYLRRWDFHLVRESLRERDRKSTRLNSSHGYISYAVFCLKKKKHTLKYFLERR